MADLLNIDVQGNESVEDYIARFQKNLNSVQILDEAAALMFARNRARFLQQVDPEGNPWIPSGAALKRKALGQGGGTLYKTGKLYGSIQLYTVDPDNRAIGTDVSYAPFHQFGTVKLPQRQFLGFGQEDTRLAGALVLKRVVEALT